LKEFVIKLLLKLGHHELLYLSKFFKTASAAPQLIPCLQSSFFNSFLSVSSCCFLLRLQFINAIASFHVFTHLLLLLKVSDILSIAFHALSKNQLLFSEQSIVVSLL
jgi:hypothetical protein